MGVTLGTSSFEFTVWSGVTWVRLVAIAALLVCCVCCRQTPSVKSQTSERQTKTDQPTEKPAIRKDQYQEVRRASKALEARLSVGTSYTVLAELVAKFALEIDMLPKPSSPTEDEITKDFKQALEMYKDAFRLQHAADNEWEIWGSTNIYPAGYIAVDYSDKRSFPLLTRLNRNYGIGKLAHPVSSANKLVVINVQAANTLIWTKANALIDHANANIEE